MSQTLFRNYTLRTANHCCVMWMTKKIVQKSHSYLQAPLQISTWADAPVLRGRATSCHPQLQKMARKLESDSSKIHTAWADSDNWPLLLWLDTAKQILQFCALEQTFVSDHGGRQCSVGSISYCLQESSSAQDWLPVRCKMFQKLALLRKCHQKVTFSCDCLHSHGEMHLSTI